MTPAEVATLISGRGVEAAGPHLDALAPSDVIEALVAQPYPQYAAAIIARDVDRLAPALYEYLATHDPYPERAVLLGALIGLHRVRGSALEQAYHPWLADVLAEGWSAENVALHREALLALPPSTREALILAPRTGWSYLDTCEPTPDVIRVAVHRAALASAPPFPGYHPVVLGLASLGAPAIDPIARAIPVASRPATRILFVAALGKLAVRAPLGELAIAALRLTSRDPDPQIRRFAREGLELAGHAVRLADTPPRLADVIALRSQLDPALVAAARTLAISIDETVSAHNQATTSLERSDYRSHRDEWMSRELLAPPAPMLCALSAAWFAELRAGSRAGAFAAGIRMLAEVDDPLVSWCIADLICRYPPTDSDPFRPVLDLYAILAEAPPAIEHAVASALGEMLSPDDAYNPIAIYDWLVTREPRIPADANAIAWGTLADQPEIRDSCTRFAAGPPAQRPFSLAELAAAFAPIAAGGYWGVFALVAFDRDANAGIFLTSERRERIDLVAGDRDARFRAALAIAASELGGTVGTFTPTVLDRDGARERWTEIIVGDRSQPAKSVAATLATALFAVVPHEVECWESYGVYEDIAMPYAIWIVDRTDRIALCLIYANDQ